MDSNRKNFSIRCMHIYRLKGCIQSWYCTYCLIFIFIFILERHRYYRCTILYVTDFLKQSVESEIGNRCYSEQSPTMVTQGHRHTSSAHPPRCLPWCKWNSPQSFITTRWSASRALERFSAVTIAVSQPFLSRKWAKNGGKLGFGSVHRNNL